MSFSSSSDGEEEVKLQREPYTSEQLQRIQRIFFSRPSENNNTPPQRRREATTKFVDRVNFEKKARPREMEEPTYMRHEATTKFVDKVNFEKKAPPREMEQPTYMHHHHLRHNRFSKYASKVCNQELERSETLDIDPHIHVLHSTAQDMFNHQETKLNDTKEKVQRVVDELKLVTAQEERSLENRINGLKEKFTASVECLEHEFMQKIDGYRKQLHGEIEREKQQCTHSLNRAAAQLQRSLKSDMESEIAANINVPEILTTEQMDVCNDFMSPRSILSPRRPVRSPALPNLHSSQRIQVPSSRRAEQRRDIAVKMNVPEIHTTEQMNVSDDFISPRSILSPCRPVRSPVRSPARPHLHSSQRRQVPNSRRAEPRRYWAVNESDSTWEKRELSPLSKTRIKLQRLEAKLASYSDLSIWRAERTLREASQPQRTLLRTSYYRESPRSPLKKTETKWKIETCGSPKTGCMPWRHR